MAAPRQEEVIRQAGSGKTHFFYRLCRSSVRAFSRIYFRARVEGAENLPKDGPCLMLANHASMLDPMVIGSMLDREIHFLARDGLFRVPVLGLAIRYLNSHPIRREGIDREAIKLCAAILRAGWPLGIFPEGTRSLDGKVDKPRGGFGMILEKYPDVPCVPMLILGSNRALGRGMIFPRPAHIRLKIGPSFIFEPKGEEESRRAFYQRCADELEARWKAMGAYEG